LGKGQKGGKEEGNEQEWAHEWNILAKIGSDGE
jgi:hypothetical protein